MRVGMALVVAGFLLLLAAGWTGLPVVIASLVMMAAGLLLALRG